MNPQVPTGGSTVHDPLPFRRVALHWMSVANGGWRLVGTNSTVPVGTPPPAEVTVTFNVAGWPACTVSGWAAVGRVICVVVANLPLVGLFETLMVAVPDEGLCRALPEYLAVIVLVPGLVNWA